MRLFAFLTAALLLAAPHVASSSDEQRLTPEEARLVASTALLQGNLPLAARMSDALIDGNPEDAEALLIRSAVALEAGRYDLSQRAAKQAWAAADNPSARHQAALLVAQALEAKGRYFQAELWLRKSLQIAPDDAAENETRRAYRALQKSNPWRVEIGFGIAPSSNVNNGTAAETVELFGLDFHVSETAQALSGYETFAQAEVSRRLSFGRQHRTDLVFGTQVRRYWLSEESRDTAPELDVAELSYEDISVGLSHQQVLSERLEVEGYLGVDSTRRGGEKYSDQLDFGLKFAIPVQKGAALIAKTKISKEWLDDSDDSTALRLSGALGFRKLLPKHVVWGDLGVSQVQSDRESMAYNAHSLAAGVELREPFLTAWLAAAVSAERRHYDRPWHSGAARNDDIVSFTLTSVFTELEQYGFSPRIDVTAQRRESTIDFYDQNAFGIRLGIQSTF